MPIDAPRPGTARVRSDAARRIPRLRPPDRRSACPHFLWSSLWTSRASAAQPIDPATFFPPRSQRGNATAAHESSSASAPAPIAARARARPWAAGVETGLSHFLWPSLWTSCASDPQAIDPAVQTSPDQSSGTRQRRPRNRPTNADGRAPWRSILAVLRVAASAHRRFSACFQPRRSRRLFHNFCWQACGQAEHWAFNPLIRRPFPERVKQAATHANRAVGRRMISRCHALSPACRATSTSAHPVSRIRHPVSGIRRRYIGHRARMAFSTTFVGKLVDILSIRRPTR